MKKQNKSAFVRRFEPGTPAKDIVAAAKKQGIKLSERYVYVIRSNANVKSRRGVSVNAKVASFNENALRSAIAELGLTRARQVLAEVEKAFG